MAAASPILVLVRKDFVRFFRNRPAVTLTFVIPFLMIYVFGHVFGVNRADSGPKSIPLAVVNQSTDPAAAALINALQADAGFKVITEFTPRGQPPRPLAESDLEPLMQAANADFRFAVVLPPDLLQAGRLGLKLKVLANPRNEIETQTVNGLLQKTLYAQMPTLLGATLQGAARESLGEARLQVFNQRIAQAVADNFGGDPGQIEQNLAAGNFFPASTVGNADADASPLSRLVRVETVQVVGANVKSPLATNLVGGWAVQFLLFALSASAASLFRERDAGIFQRLLASPVTRAHILWSKFCYGLSLGLLQLMVLFLAGRVLFGIDIGAHLLPLVVVCLFAAGACTSFGMLLAAVAPNADAASGLSTFLILLMSALGGAWFPLSLMPDFMQQLARLTLVYWSMEGFSAVLWAGHSFAQLLPILAVLGGITAVVMTLAIWRFNRSNLFD